MKKWFCLLLMFSSGLSVLSETQFAQTNYERIPEFGCVESMGSCQGGPPA